MKHPQSLNSNLVVRGDAETAGAVAWKRATGVSTIVLIGFAALTLQHCSNSPGSFAQSASSEAQDLYASYEAISKSDAFKKALEKTQKSDLGAGEPAVDELTYRGKKYVNIRALTKIEQKQGQWRGKGKVADLLKFTDKNFGKLSASDFDIGDKLLHDTLSTLGKKTQSELAFKKYTSEDLHRGLRANIVAQLLVEASGSQTSAKASLALVQAPVVAGAVAVANAAGGLATSVAGAHKTMASAEVIKACAGIMNTCKDGLTVSNNTKGLENWNECKTHQPKTASCTNGVYRYNKGATYPGNGETGKDCGNFKWVCTCSESELLKDPSKSFDPETNSRKHGDDSRAACEWELPLEGQPPAPGAVRFEEAVKMCLILNPLCDPAKGL